MVDGSTFEIWYDADSGQTVNSIDLKSDHKTITGLSFTTDTGNWEYDMHSGNGYDRRYTVTVPANTPEDRYQLILNTNNGIETSDGAVKVIQEFRDEYYIVGTGCAHRYQNYDADRDGDSDDDDKVLILRKMSEILKVCNILDVQLFFEAGDNIYSPGGKGAYYNPSRYPGRPNLSRHHEYFQGIEELDIIGVHKTSAATFMTAGNHEAPDNTANGEPAAELAQYFNDEWGMYYHNTVYGNARYLNINNGWGGGQYDPSGQTRKLRDELDAGPGRGNFVVGILHKKEGSSEGPNNQIPFDLSLVAHNHTAANSNPYSIGGGPAIQYVADSNKDSTRFELNLFRINNANGTYTTPSGSNSRMQIIEGTVSSKMDDDPATWVRKLELNYTNNNNGSASSNTGSIINRHNFALEDAKIRFVMAGGATYSVTGSGAVIKQQFTADNGDIVVDVAVDVPANTTVNVDINSGGGPTVTIPSVSFDNPTLSLVEGGSLQFDVTATDPDGIQNVKLYMDGALVRTEGQDPYQWGLSGQPDTVLQNLAAGTYEFKAVAMDTVGDEGEAIINVTVTPVADTTAPVVSFDNPTTSLLEGSDIDFTINATDANDIVVVRLYKDGVELNRSEGGHPYNFGLPGQPDTELQSLAVGTYEFKATAEDDSGNIGEATVTVVVDPIPDTTAPTVSFDNPTTSLYEGESIDFTISATDDNNVVVVRLYKDGVELNRSEGAAPYTFGEPQQGDSELLNLLVGTYEFKATAEDDSGNIGEATVTVVVDPVPDVTAPSVSFDNPTTSLIEGESIDFIINATDENAVVAVRLYKDNVELSRTATSSPYTFGVGDSELANLAVGTYEFKATAEDDSGNIGEATVTVVVDPAPDTTAPTISFDNPTLALNEGDDLAVTVNASDANGVSVVRLYKDNVELSRTATSAPYTFGQAGQNDSELENLAAGSYVIKAVAEDSSGNLGEATITVTVSAANSLFIEAESFDLNSGFQTETTTDAGGGLNLAYANPGDYVEYNISSILSDSFEVVFRVASATQGAKFDLSVDGNVLCTIDEPATGGNQTWITTAPQYITLPAGDSPIVITSNGNSWNLNWFELTLVDHQPTKIEAESFDTTGGVTANGDGSFGFQTQSTSDVGGGQNIGFTDTDDYADYGIDVAVAGPYEVIFRVASASRGAKFDLMNGSTVLTSVDEPATGGFQTWVTTAPQIINLPAGSVDLRVLATDRSWNMNWFELTPYVDRVSVEAEAFDSTNGFGTQNTSDVGGGQNLKDATAGDTATYQDIDIPVSGIYEVTFRIASLNQNVNFDLKSGGNTLVTVDQPATGGYQSWTSWATSGSSNVHLNAGLNTFVIEANGVGWNLNWFDFKLVTAD